MVTERKDVSELDCVIPFVAVPIEYCGIEPICGCHQIVKPRKKFTKVSPATTLILHITFSLLQTCCAG